MKCDLLVNIPNTKVEQSHPHWKDHLHHKGNGPIGQYYNYSILSEAITH